MSDHHRDGYYLFQDEEESLDLENTEEERDITYNHHERTQVEQRDPYGNVSLHDACGYDMASVAPGTISSLDSFSSIQSLWPIAGPSTSGSTSYAHGGSVVAAEAVYQPMEVGPGLISNQSDDFMAFDVSQPDPSGNQQKKKKQPAYLWPIQDNPELEQKRTRSVMAFKNRQKNEQKKNDLEEQLFEVETDRDRVQSERDERQFTVSYLEEELARLNAVAAGDPMRLYSQDLRYPPHNTNSECFQQGTPQTYMYYDHNDQHYQ